MKAAEYEEWKDTLTAFTIEPQRFLREWREKFGEKPAATVSTTMWFGRLKRLPKILGVHCGTENSVAKRSATIKEPRTSIFKPCMERASLR